MMDDGLDGELVPQVRLIGHPPQRPAPSAPCDGVAERNTADDDET
jgi:hypothetical protein